MAYVFQEYPKWVNGQVAQDEAEEAAILATEPKPARAPTVEEIVETTLSSPALTARLSPRIVAQVAAEADERKAIMAQLKALEIPFFKGAPTDVLKAKLPQ